MPSHSQRPRHGEPLPLDSGDFEEVRYATSSRGADSSRSSDEYYPHIPAAPRAPVFHRSVAPNAYPSHYGVVPPAPSSLAPVVMAYDQNAVATGPQRAMTSTQDTVVIHARPTMRAGMMILAAGALLGGLVGVFMHARQNAADAAFAAAQRSSVNEPVAAVALPPFAATALPNSIAPTSLPPFGKLAMGRDVAPPGAIPGLAATAPVASNAPGTKPEKAEKAEKKAEKHATSGARWTAHAPSTKPAAKDKDDGYKVASAGDNDKAETKKPAQSEKPERPAAPEKPSRPEKPGGKDDANAVLKAAANATANTL